MWDDEVDETSGVFYSSMTEAQAFRRGTVRYVAKCLCLDAVNEHGPEPENYIIQSFQEIGHSICREYSHGSLLPIHVYIQC